MNKQYYLDMVTEFRQKVEEAPSTDNRYRLASSLGALGNYIAEEERSFHEAIRLHQEAKDIYHSIGEYDGEAKACFNIGATYEVGLHDKKSAWTFIKQAMALVQDEKLMAKYEPEFKRLERLGKLEGWIADD